MSFFCSLFVVVVVVPFSSFPRTTSIFFVCSLKFSPPFSPQKTNGCFLINSTGQRKNYGFVTFETEEALTRAVSRLLLSLKSVPFLLPKKSKERRKRQKSKGEREKKRTRLCFCSRFFLLLVRLTLCCVLAAMGAREPRGLLNRADGAIPAPDIVFVTRASAGVEICGQKGRIGATLALSELRKKEEG